MGTVRGIRFMGVPGVVLHGVMVCLWCWPALAPEPDAALQADEIRACQASLNRIFEAIQEYRNVRGALPGFLSDLEPEFIADPRLFICPGVQRRGDYATWRRGVGFGVFADPLLPTTYAYEFCANPYPLWAGHFETVQEYKLRQVQIVGSNVPILRCLVHRPYLNLSIGGLLYWSGKDWEDNFTNQVGLERLLPHQVFKDLAPIPGRYTNHIPGRAPATEARLIDLSAHYDAAFQNPWLIKHPRGIHLGDLPLGVVKLDGLPVPFDVRGLIQLYGTHVIAPFPERVEGIRVSQRCRRIHFLHGAAFRDPVGTRIGHYEIRYQDRASVQIPIIYGEDVVSAWDAGAKAPPGRAAWLGTKSRVFHRVWANPRSEVTIDDIDFCSAVSAAGPFLIAITLEP